MAWIESHEELGQHPKLLRLARQLDIPRAQAIGHLQYLWWWALKYAGDGDLSGMAPSEIAEACTWDGEPEAFVEALTMSGFLDWDGDNLVIHDWSDYAGRLIEHRKLNNKRNIRNRQLYGNFELVQEVRARDGDTCRYCSLQVDWKDRKSAKGGTYDHIDPEGPNTPANIVVSCKGCNSKKGRRTPELAGMYLNPISTSISTSSGRKNLPTVPNRTVPNRTVPGDKAAEASFSQTVETTAWVPPEFFKPLLELVGYKSRGHTKAAETLKSQCDEAGVSVETAIANFAEFYKLNRTRYGWSDPVAACRRNIDKTIAQLLGRPQTYLNGRASPNEDFHARRIRAEKAIPIRKAEEI